MRKCGLIVLIAVVTAVAVAFSAGAKRNAKYVGSEVCRTCHADSHKALVQAHMKTLHRAAMADATAAPGAIVAKFEADAPINRADVKWVLGKGVIYQNYLDGDLKLLPGKWLTKEQRWVAADAVDSSAQCVGCHTTNFDPETKKWTELGVGCEACHGPGGVHAESMEAKDIIDLKKLDGKKKDMVCGQCHAHGTDSSGKYAFSTTYVPGQDLMQSFKLKDPKPGGLNQQYNEFVSGKHAAGGMKCTTCHDSHGDKAKAARQLKKPVNDLCMGCHASEMGDSAAIASLKAHAPSAKPDDTCATCHMPGGSHAFKKAAK